MENKKLFYTMGEVSEMFDVSSSLIRYWEKQFGVIKPVRNKKGNRLFTPKDIENFKLIYHLVKERGMTLEGAKKSLRGGKLPQERDVELMDRLLNMRSLLLEVREVLKDEYEESQSPNSAQNPKGQVDSELITAALPESTADKSASATENMAQVVLPANRSSRKSNNSKEKELFAFYEQNLF